jgi:protocatechuate 3,4-dioxygenase beta subunit
MTSTNGQSVEIVVLAADEAETLTASIRHLHSCLRSDQRFASLRESLAITVVDHASRDATWDVARSLAEELDGVRAVRLLERLDTKGLRARWASSSADVVAFIRVSPTMDIDGLLAPLAARARIVPVVAPSAPPLAGDRYDPRALSRRAALAALGGFGLTALVAACGGSSKAPAKAADTTSGANATPSTTTGANPAPSTTAGNAAGTGSTAAPVASGSALALTPEMTQGPYYLDLNLVRSDIREDRVGVPLTLAVTVVDPAGAPIKDATVDIWHCDAEGIYSGFVSASASSNGGPGGGPGGPPPGGPPSGGGPGGPPASDGQGGPGGPPPGAGPGPGAAPGQAGGLAATPSDPSTFLRGSQQSDASGKLSFITLYPGWYQGRTVHIHVLVHVGGNVTHIGQLFFDDAFTDGVYKADAPYSKRPARTTRNDSDGIFQGGGAQTLLAVTKAGDGYATSVTMAVKTAQ